MNIYDLSLIRSTKKALVFYIAHLIVVVLLGALFGGVWRGVIGGPESDAFETGVKIGTVVATVYTLILVFALIIKKKLVSGKYVMLGIVSGILALAAGGIGGLIIPSLITTRPNNFSEIEPIPEQTGEGISS